EPALLEVRAHALADALVANREEAGDVLRITGDQLVAQIEDVHCSDPSAQATPAIRLAGAASPVSIVRATVVNAYRFRGALLRGWDKAQRGYAMPARRRSSSGRGRH